MRSDLKINSNKKASGIDQVLEDRNLRHAFFNHDQLMFGFIDNNMDMVKVSKSMAASLGYTPEEMAGMSLIEMSDPRDDGENLPIYKFMVQHNEPAFFMHPTKYKKIDGTLIQVQCLQPIFLEEEGFWLIYAYQIPLESKGVSVLTDNYQNFLNGGKK
jgi:PAS domain S-box-containing protein